MLGEPGRATVTEARPGSTIRPYRGWRPLRWLANLAVAAIALGIVDSVVTNPRFQWGVVGQYLTNSAVLAGLVTTIYLTVIAMAIGVILGTVIAVMRLSASPLLSGTATVYVTLFRGSPVLVQLIFWFNLSAVYPHISLGLPGGPTLLSVSANSLITPTLAAILGLGLNEGAYMSEIVRAGIQSVPAGQTEAAQAIGMTKPQILRRVVLPQAMRVVLPPTGNEAISMLKTTAIVSVIGTSDLLYSAQSIYTRTFQVIPLLMVASVWYLVATTILYLFQRRIERRFGRGFAQLAGTDQSRPLRRAARRVAAAAPASFRSGRARSER
jgi:polar amino acid transport system permease protein